ncbi:MAG: leucyl aminopeptidase [Candidatus Omnitrophica bacterium]|nr:leucyl aminopeptidase [Candidatus Omnitrophota bacterium]
MRFPAFMKIEVSTKTLDRQPGDVLTLPVAEGGRLPSWAGRWPSAARKLVEPLLKSKDFTGKLNELAAFPAPGGLPVSWVYLVGVGKERELTPDRLRQVIAVAARRAQAQRRKALVFPVVGVSAREIPAETAGQVLAEGAVLGTYRFTLYKTLKPEEQKRLEKVTLAVGRGISSAAVATGAKNGTLIADAVGFSRDLINLPANHKYPEDIAARVQKNARKNTGASKISCRIIKKAELTRLGLNAILAVGQGSVHPPVLVALEYKGPGAGSKPPLVFVGKGITFDSGGISIKPSGNMDQMKYDMSGGAAAAGAIQAIAGLKLPVHVVGIIPFSENLPSGSAQRPGDIIRTFSGKTVEVLNTDAEGRLVLADALSFARRSKPAAMIDLATLTGACVVALGKHACALLTNHDGFARQVKEAAARTHERVWELPLWPEYSEQVKSGPADLKNIGDDGAGTIIGAVFLKEFVGNIPWVHLDIAGTAWADKDQAYLSKGGTGFGVRLLTALAADWKPLPSTVKVS